MYPYPASLSLRTWLSDFGQQSSAPVSLCIGEVKALFGQEQRSTAQFNAFYFAARPVAISVSLPAFSLQDLGKCRTSKLLSKVDSAAQSFFIFNVMVMWLEIFASKGLSGCELGLQNYC